MIENFSRSLTQMLGADYIEAVCSAQSALTGKDKEELLKIADEKVDFFPAEFAKRQEELMEKLGEQLVPKFENDLKGAPTSSYGSAQHSSMAPVGGCGCYRIGEDGRLYFAGKSEHYHIPLGHSFPGYRLIENAKKLGIPNATHNNTRGFITRTLERRLVAKANGLSENSKELDELLEKKEAGVLNRVINIETGSLAVEAALKMMLSRFYSLDGKAAKYKGKTPVFFVMADNAGGITANYHGTTVIAQTLRGLWPDFYEKAEKNELYKIVSVGINDIDDFKEKLEKYNKGKYKTAGFCHEIIMMNYGGIRLDKGYLQEAYSLCREEDTPVLCDEIQSCAWYDSLYLFLKYELKPDFVSIGKGFGGGCYPASKCLCSGAYDSLSQFGALVTNGQEELASLSYLITIEFISENGAHIEETGKYYHSKVKEVAARHEKLISGVEGDAHMTALCFSSAETVTAFCKRMNEVCCIDISAQTYKPNCPPVALTKLPIIISNTIADGIALKIDECLAAIEEEV